jgi:hypothetical protein
VEPLAHEDAAAPTRSTVSCCCQNSMFAVMIPVTAGGPDKGSERHPVPMYHEDFSALGKRRRMERQVGNGDSHRVTERNGDEILYGARGRGRPFGDLASGNQGTLYITVSGHLNEVVGLVAHHGTVPIETYLHSTPTEI